jgi:transcriptional regulator with XRE-family HTH domain
MATSPQMADLSLGQRIRLARTNAGLTMKELAARIGVHPDSISDYEADRTDPSARVLGAISLETNVSADWLLIGATRAYPSGKPSHLRLIHGTGKGSTTRQLPLVR